ncbi:MAG: hypothetical protein PWP23_1082 [Candidatus Sumerlaeota bacterium]|nr:hypothetical protein [Candidatus Sumerlaeota bacterium]
MVFVDDDNVLATDYLENVLAILASHPRVGAAGGRIVPEFEEPPPAWVRQFDKALALRDLGGEVLLASPMPRGAATDFPECAPIGAGLVLRREPARRYAEAIRSRKGRVIADRTGNRLSSGGDNDLVLTVLENGWEAGYFPQLALTHLIPASRCTRTHLARLLRESHRSWFAVLDAHGLRPRRPVPPLLAPALKMRAWLQLHAWRGPVEFLHWQDRCGEIEGRSNLR